MKCSVDGCDKPKARRRAQYCEMHYYRLRRNGTTDALRDWNRRDSRCSHEGCDNPHQSIGFCAKHAARLRRRGTPGAEPIHQRDRNLPRGEANIQWTGSGASYVAVHQRLASQRGPARNFTCVDCGAAAAHWSYTHKSEDEKLAKQGPYSTDLAEYDPRCVKCHKRHDLDAIKRRQAAEEGFSKHSWEPSGMDEFHPDTTWNPGLDAHTAQAQARILDLLLPVASRSCRCGHGADRHGHEAGGCVECRCRAYPDAES